MKKNLVLLLLIFAAKISAQEVSFNQIKEQHEAFEYERVIQLSNTFIKQGGISDSLKIEVYQMRVVAFYSLGDEQSTQNSFKEILKINRNYAPDPSRISPRLITIFQAVKENYLNSLVQETAKKDAAGQPEKIFTPSHLKSAAFKNIFVPGWGQISNGYSTKGYLFAVSSSINLAAMIYFIFDTKNKEDRYLKEINKNLIQAKYDSFNKSYKIRNTLIASYLIIWLYSQLDLHLFNNRTTDSFSELNEIAAEGINYQFKLSWRVPFSL